MTDSYYDAFRATLFGPNEMLKAGEMWQDKTLKARQCNKQLLCMPTTTIYVCKDTSKGTLESLS